MAQLNKETQQVVTGMTLNRTEAYILAVIGTMNQSNARVIARNMKATLGDFGLTEADLKDFFTKIEGPELVIPEGLPKVELKAPGKFTKGDRVVFNCNYGPDDVTKGNTGTVERAYVKYKDNFVEVKLDKGGTTTCWASRVDHLTEQQPKPKLRVGARILIVDSVGTHGYHNGGEYTVIRVSTAKGAFFIDDDGDENYAYGSEFEVIG